MFWLINFTVFLRCNIYLESTFFNLEMSYHYKRCSVDWFCFIYCYHKDFREFILLSSCVSSFMKMLSIIFKTVIVFLTAVWTIEYILLLLLSLSQYFSQFINFFRCTIYMEIAFTLFIRVSSFRKEIIANIQESAENFMT